ncbi:hypothetical protein B0F90DRAFT_1138112 [Multifurca ochricompacta]|uniref:Uncharacterized protein n=1 Tax=Multifurca ochricompacta TaxID=376703 RepID=A0AAD4QL63_9AGAM|nr:hypothetical protein B0F90DRAFT_1138112 [Multifurca ochricompacta]
MKDAGPWTVLSELPQVCICSSTFSLFISREGRFHLVEWTVGALACVSVPFALDLNLTDSTALDVTRTLADRHLRLSVARTTGFENLIAVAGSESYLDEAAKIDMDNSIVKLVHCPAQNWYLDCVDLGQRRANCGGHRHAGAPCAVPREMDIRQRLYGILASAYNILKMPSQPIFNGQTIDSHL